MATTKVIVCPPPPPPPSPQLTTNSSAPHGTVTEVTAQSSASASARSELQGFGSQPWQGWFSQVYNQIKSQFVTTTAVADTANTNASSALATAAAAIAAVGTKLNRSAADILSGAIDIQTAGGFKAGTMVWDSSGNYVSGYGVAMTTKGIVGYSSSLGAVSFAINATTGDASFAGNLSAASGTFTGTLVSVNGTFTGSLVATSMTGGTIIGTNIKTGSGFPRTEIDSTGLRAYDSGGNVILTADYSGVFCTKLAGAAAGAIVGSTASNTAAATQGTSSGSAAGGAFFNTGAGPALSCNATGNNALNIDAGTNGIVQNGGGSNFLHAVFPITDNAYALGLNGSLRWTAVYAMSSTITTSDERTKNSIESLDTAMTSQLVLGLRPVQYKMNIGHNAVTFGPQPEGGGPAERIVTAVPGKRFHYGFLAQEVKESLTAAGVEDAALWCLADPADSRSGQALRMEEFIPLLVATVQRLATRIDVLEAAAAAGGV
jgi:hypothetical protein